MAQAESPSLAPSIYTPTRQRQLLMGILVVSITIPVVAREHLSPLIILFPIITVGGIALVRSGRPERIPTWIIFNTVSSFLIIYSGYIVGTTLPFRWLVIFLIVLMIYDILAVRGGTMQSLNRRMMTTSIPVVILIPHSPEFSYESFRTLISEDGFKALHDSPHGVMMLGIGDAILPAALGVGASTLGASHALGPLTVTLPQLGAIIGGLIGLAFLIWVELPRPIAALTVSVPGALLGLGAGYWGSTLHPLAVVVG